MKVTTTVSRQKSPADTPEHRFNQAWQRIVKQRQKNEQILTQAKDFVDMATEKLEWSEKSYCLIINTLCHKFLEFYRRKSLSQWQRQELMHWFNDYYQALQFSPFTNAQDMVILKENLEYTLTTMHPEMEQMFDEMTTEPEYNSSEAFEDETVMGDFEAFFDSDEAHAFFEDSFGDFFQQQAESEKHRQEDQALNTLMKTGAINKLFRKLLRQLHPDLEQDESRQKLKNQLVSQLTEARDKADIGLLFSMYAEHMGESPLQILGEQDLDKATKILQRQFEQLRDQKDEILMQLGPHEYAIYQRFHRKTAKASEKAIHSHIKELEKNTHNMMMFHRDVTSLAKLKPYLEERYYLEFDRF